MNIIKNSITQKEYTELVTKVDSIGTSNSMTLAQCDKYKFVVGATDNDFIYIDLVDKSTDSMINNVLIKPDGTLGGRGVDNRSVCLYHNAGGTQSTITLSQPVSNFTYIEVFFKYVYTGDCKSGRLFGAEGKQYVLDMITDYEGAVWRYSARPLFSGNTVTWHSTLSSKDGVSTWNGLAIYRIVGHVA